MKLSTLTVSAVLFLAAHTVAYGAANLVTLRPQCEVKPACAVILRDIADIQGPKALVEKAGDMTVTTAPPAGQRRTIDSTYIRTKIEAANPDTSIEVKGARQVCLVGKCVKISSQQLAEEAKAFVLSQLPQSNRTYDVVFERNPRDLTLGSEEEIQIRPRLLNSSMRLGVNTVALDVLVDGRIAATTSAALQVRAVADTLVVTNAIKQGEALTIQNSSWEQRDVTRNPDAIIMGTDGNVPELVARRSLAPGALVTSADVNTPLIVHKGDSVALTVRFGNIVLQTAAEAMQDGRIGDSVRVKTTISSEDVRGRIISAGNVEISR